MQLEVCCPVVFQEHCKCPLRHCKDSVNSDSLVKLDTAGQKAFDLEMNRETVIIILKVGYLRRSYLEGNSYLLIRLYGYIEGSRKD